MYTSNRLARAEAFATERHGAINHRRKYTDEPYIVHPRAVARLVGRVTNDVDMLVAAWLHDTVEDTQTELAEVYEKFGDTVGRYVQDLTDVSKPSDGVRAVRKKKDLIHLAKALPESKTIKLADLIDNTGDIRKNDPKFAKVYLREASALLDVLTEGNAYLHRQATFIIRGEYLRAPGCK